MSRNKFLPPKAHIWWNKGMKRWMCAVVGGGRCCTGWGSSPLIAYLSWRHNYYQEEFGIRQKTNWTDL